MPDRGKDQNRKNGTTVRYPVGEVGIAMQPGDRLQNFDQRAESCECEEYPEITGARDGEGCQQGKRRESRHVQRLVAGVSRHLRRRWKQGHRQCEGYGQIEQGDPQGAPFCEKHDA